jgi:hypothetical protein
MWSTAEEVCSFAVAIACYRHVVTIENQKKQFSAVELAEEMNSLPFSDQADLNVDTVALQQGLVKFKKGIMKLLSLEFITMNPFNKDAHTVPLFINLPPIFALFDIKFVSLTVQGPLLTVLDIKSGILTMRNKIMNFTKSSNASNHLSQSAAMGQVYFESKKAESQSVISTETLFIKKLYGDLLSSPIECL